MTDGGITPSQTVGPFFGFALTPMDGSGAALAGNDLMTPDTIGQPIRIRGRIIDGAGQPVPDAMVEIWQADGAGRYAGGGTAALPNTSFRGFGRVECDRAGTFEFATVKPGAVPGPDGKMQAPHINVSLFARGLLRRLFTRIYFSDEPGNATDPILALVPEDARGTLIAGPGESRDATPGFIFDIHLQGPNETVFFEA